MDDQGVGLAEGDLEPPNHEFNELDWKASLSPDKKRLTAHLSALANQPGEWHDTEIVAAGGWNADAEKPDAALGGASCVGVAGCAERVQWDRNRPSGAGKWHAHRVSSWASQR